MNNLNDSMHKRMSDLFVALYRYNTSIWSRKSKIEIHVGYILQKVYKEGYETYQTIPSAF